MVDGSSVLNLINCTVIQNFSANNTGFSSGGVFYGFNATLNMTNTILSNNNSVGAPNCDLNSFAASYTGTNIQNIVEVCIFGAGTCPGFFSSADPNLSGVSICGWQDIYRPNSGSVAIDNGFAAGAPPADICGTTWVNNPEIGNVESAIPGSALDFDGVNGQVNLPMIIIFRQFQCG
jgi:hypothetical protein